MKISSLSLYLGLALQFLVITADAEPIRYVERFVLAENREAVLKELIPGTEDHYFYHALHYQNTGQTEEFSTTMEQWATRYPQSGQRKILENRQALLNFDADPEGTLDYLKRELNLTFDHERARRQDDPNLPMAIDAAEITRRAFLEMAVRNRDDLQLVTDHGLESLVRDGFELSPSQLRELLERISRPDFPQLVDLIVEELAMRESRGFGAYDIHSVLFLEQLDRLAELRPSLMQDTVFVYAYVGKLVPNEDINMERDREAYRAYLERLKEFVSELSPSFNSLKAHTLYHLLENDLERGNYDADRLIEYLKLPRAVTYINPRYLEVRQRTEPLAEFSVDFTEVTSLPSIPYDHDLIRDYLMELLKDEEDPNDYASYLERNWLDAIFAEAKILSGTGDQEKWFSLLTPEAYQALLERVDIRFAPENPKHFDVENEVKLSLDIKNVRNLIVKTYQISTLNYYQSQEREITSELDLDGLVANEEQSFSYDEGPLRRVRHEFEFPNLTGRGVWVIEFIGNGKSSRALIRKGQIQYLSETRIEGERLYLIDESNRPVPNGSAWLGTREFKADENGIVTLPFGEDVQSRQVILSDADGFSSLGTIELPGEVYELQGGFVLNREELIAGQEATLLVRTTLLLNGAPVSLAVLENVRLTLTATDHGGVRTTSEVKDIELSEMKEWVHKFQVPERFTKMEVQLNATVPTPSRGGEQSLVSKEIFTINQIDQTSQISDFHLSSFGGQWVVEMLGKTGEPVANRAVLIEIRHQDVSEDLHFTLQTNGEGRILLGSLNGISRVKASADGHEAKRWFLPSDRSTLPNNLHGVAGEPLRIAYTGKADEVTSEHFSLMEVRGHIYHSNHLDKLQLSGGFLVIDELAAGDYELYLKESDDSIYIRIADGVKAPGVVLGDTRHLTTRRGEPLQIISVTTRQDALTVQLGNTNPATRLHVIANRFLPAFDLYELAPVTRREVEEIRPGWAPNVYLSGRQIGDEYRYILDRRYAARYPGNLLSRPGLLLNPWVLRSTDTETDEAIEGEQHELEGEPQVAQRRRYDDSDRQQVDQGWTDFASLDFLAEDSVILANLTPDEDGLVTISADDLGDRQYITLLAIDPQSTVKRDVSLPEVETEFRDIRLADALDAGKDYAEKKSGSLVVEGDKIVIEDPQSAEITWYHSLDKVYQYLLARSNHNANLTDFSFVLRWPGLSDEEKRAKYSEYASHELNFFLSKKDPKFFEEVIQPYLANKKEKKFLDHYLLGADLARYLEPWSFARLNIAERALLVKRLEGDPASNLERHLNELFELIPPSPEEDEMNFLTALRSSNMEVGERLGRLTEELAKDGAFERTRAERLSESEMESRWAMPSPAMDAVEESVAAYALGDRDLALGAQVDGFAPMGGVVGNQTEFFARPEEAQTAVRPLYRKLDATKEWAENQYYHLPLDAQGADLVEMNAFWNDYTNWDGQGAFVSSNFTEVTSSFAEMMLALGVLDLPFEGKEPELTREDQQIELTAMSTMILFRKEVKAAPKAADQSPLLVSQNYFRVGDRYQRNGSEQSDKFITNEFLTGVVYGGEVVVTNPTSSAQQLDLLIQIPAGSIPVNGSRETMGAHVRLDPYSTHKKEFFFYFPEAGTFPQYPVHLSQNEETIAQAEPFVFNVVDELSTLDTQSWEYVSQWGSEDDVIGFLEETNLLEIDLSRIAWRMKEEDFFNRVIDLIEARYVYDDTLYRYAVLHGEQDPLNQFLLNQEEFIAQCGSWLESPILTIDPIERFDYQHLEYRPLVNPRVHILGGDPKILNDAFYAQYHRLLEGLKFKENLDDVNELSLVYYLFLQDRVEEALSLVEKIDPDALPTKVQYDYMMAYAAFYREDLSAARGIAEKYVDYPVDRWREYFAVVLDQLKEIEGQATQVQDEDDRDQRQDQLASTEPGFDFTIADANLRITYQNLSELKINYYEMDIEFLFSSSPFVAQDSTRFSLIKPNQSETRQLEGNTNQLVIPLPREFRGKNVLVEILAGGQRKSEAYYSNTLDVQLAENYGRLEVNHAEDQRPLSKVYVKVYARFNDGRVAFYKDGYTDLRGKFDYTSLNTNEIDGVNRLSLLLMSEDHGAVVKEVNPPQR